MAEISFVPASACASPTPFLSTSVVQEDELAKITPVPDAHQLIDERTTMQQHISLVLSFSNLTYRVKIRQSMKWFNVISRSSRSTEDSEKVLLRDVSGEARDGEILAVLGPSGSGKTTFIDALANRIVKGSLKGTINLNGDKLGSNLLKGISAYVMQDDLLFSMLTVEETLMFAAELRLPRTVSKYKKKKRVLDLINQLDLRNAMNTVIGDEGLRGVSGGERRRVSIGVDIIHDPILLFLDEPTSGLDSASAFMVVKVLQRIAQTGSIVIMSIHQPSYRILCLLNRLIFLSHGEIVYRGSPYNLSKYLADFGNPVPEDENPSEAALDLICDLEKTPDGTKSLVHFNQTWQTTTTGSVQEPSSPLHISLKETINFSISRGKLVYGATDSATEVRTFANPFWSEIIVLSKRSFLNSRRTPERFATRLGAALLTSVLLFTLFQHMDISPVGNSERIQLIGFAISTVFFVSTDAIPILLEERNVVLRELAFNSYRKYSYCLSHALAWIPSQFFLSITLASITFLKINVGGGFWEFCFYFGIIMASFWAGSSLMALVTELFPHVILGSVVVIATISYYFLFSGSFITADKIPPYWLWFHYISPEKYGYEAVFRNVFDDPGKCFVRGIQFFDGTLLSSVPTPLKEEMMKNFGEIMGKNITGWTCMRSGVDMLKEKGVTNFSKWDCFWIIIAWGLLYRILFYFALLIGAKNKRN